jgi:integrase
VPLVEEDGRRVRGKENRQAAQLALARLKLAGQWRPTAEQAAPTEWLVVRVCSEYLEHCDRRAKAGTISSGYHEHAVLYLNDLCKFCGALPLSQLKKGHIQVWVDSHRAWRSPVTRRNVITCVLAAFHYAREMHDVPHPLKGLNKPPHRPRLHSLSTEDEDALYQAVGSCFREFLFAAIHTGLRPFCELARLTADDVVEIERGMMWRVCSSKTRKTRKIPVRPEVAALARRLMETAPRGSKKALFRNAQGNPWKKVTGVARFLAAKRRLGWDKDAVKRHYSCYTCRHTFAHRMLSGYWNGGVGCSVEVLAELIGDTPKVAFDHYGREWGQHYQEPLWSAIGEGSASAAPNRRGTGGSQRRARADARRSTTGSSAADD